MLAASGSQSLTDAAALGARYFLPDTTTSRR
jgi:hypothetical protein